MKVIVFFLKDIVEVSKYGLVKFIESKMGSKGVILCAMYEIYKRVNLFSLSIKF